MLDLLDKLDTEYNRINNLGCWTCKDDPQTLTLTASLQTLQISYLLFKAAHRPSSL